MVIVGWCCFNYSTYGQRNNSKNKNASDVRGLDS